ncbi:hypothetical protein [Nocardioides alcanivorans]|uniref:hypothetical protein n=1 Tax=Nocardioides alcanivorans TaxID=2897352 RepID=UPI001F1DBCD3|nr:hypothetical protein [Nocardioides alcanivorans]
MFAYGETVTRLRAAEMLDPYSGTYRPDWNVPPASQVDIEGWGVDDSKSAEPLEVGREAVVTDFVLYRQEPADVLPGDRVIVRGFTCEVVGRPATWRHPMTGWQAGFVVRANVVEG